MMMAYFSLTIKCSCTINRCWWHKNIFLQLNTDFSSRFLLGRREPGLHETVAKVDLIQVHLRTQVNHVNIQVNDVNNEHTGEPGGPEDTGEPGE